MALNINFKDINWHDSIDAFDKKAKATTIEQKRALVNKNKGTQVLYSTKANAAVAHLKFANQFVTRNDNKSFRIAQITQQEFDDNADELKQALTDAIDGGEFDTEIQAISDKLSNRPRKS